MNDRWERLYVDETIFKHVRTNRASATSNATFPVPDDAICLYGVERQGLKTPHTLAPGDAARSTSLCLEQLRPYTCVGEGTVDFTRHPGRGGRRDHVA